VTTGERVPWAGYGSIIIFITGFVLPLIIEHRRLGSGFEEIEATYRSNRYRKINPPREEILSPPTSPRPDQRQGSPVSMVMICAVVATGLLGFDIIDLIINMPASEMPSDRISNF